MLLVVVGAAFVLAGAVTAAWPLLALGMAQISAVMVLYLLFISTSAMVRRRNLELAWWIPAGELVGGALVAGREVKLHVLLRNRTPFAVTVPRLQILASSPIELPHNGLATRLAARQEVHLRVRATPRCSGHWFFQGVQVTVTDRVGVFALQLYYPNLLGIRVFPFLGAGRERIPFRPRTGASHERVGNRLLRQRGLGSDLREIREHVPGDPFKRIAWKATARNRKLMVREFESEILVTHWLLLDISSTMRSLDPGRSKLDYGLSLCSSFGRVALDSGDRVGMVTFDHRIHSQVKPADGQPQLYRIIERLMELHNIVDEDLTDLTDAELNGAVAEYMAYQEGVDVALRGRPPGARDPRWRDLVEGPNGELLDGAAMSREVAKALQRRRDSGSSRRLGQIMADSPRSAQLRLFCRLSGLEIPYRRHSPLISKERGMAAAINQAGTSRSSQFIVLISDLEEVGETGVVLNALRLAKRRGHTVVVVAPFAPAFLAPPADRRARQVQDIFSLRAQRQRRTVVQQIERIGISVVPAGPKDVLPLVLRRLARMKVARSGIPM